jgi:hypothetical protein
MADNTAYNELVGFTTGTGQGIVNNPRNIGDVMNNLAIRVMNETKKQLNEKVKGETSQALETSIQMPVKIFGTSFVATLFMLDYYDYINQGVQGAGGKIKSGKNKGKDWVVISQNSDYKYSTKPPPLKKGGLKYWSESKGLNPFAVRESIFKKGIKANHFWDKAYNNITTGTIFNELENDLRTAGVNATTEGIKNLFKKK